MSASSSGFLWRSEVPVAKVPVRFCSLIQRETRYVDRLIDGVLRVSVRGGGPGVGRLLREVLQGCSGWESVGGAGCSEGGSVSLIVMGLTYIRLSLHENVLVNQHIT